MIHNNHYFFPCYFLSLLLYRSYFVIMMMIIMIISFSYIDVLRAEFAARDLGTSRGEIHTSDLHCFGVDLTNSDVLRRRLFRYKIKKKSLKVLHSLWHLQTQSLKVLHSL